MSVAFRRDSDEEHLEPRFELPIPPGPNLVTRTGLVAIEARVAELEAAVAAAPDEEQRKVFQRDLRYWRQRQSSAQLAPAPRPGTVGIGTRVRFRLRGGEQALTITGFDEADPGAGRVAFSSPLARALMGAEVGDLIDFGGQDETLEVLELGQSEG